MISVYLEMVKDAMFPRKRGVITKRNKYIRIEELQHFTADEIRALRLRLHLSVGLFSEILGVSEKTVENQITKALKSLRDTAIKIYTFFFG